MVNSIKKKFIENKNKFIASGVFVPALVTGSSITSLATTNDTAQNLTTGMSGFISLVTTMIETILGSPTLSIAFAASFAFLAVRLIKKLKKA